MIRTRAIVLTLLFVSACAGRAEAQLFGERTLGRSSLNRRSRPATDSTGTVTSDRRFMRGQRSAADFVGSGQSDGGTFVGAVQGQTQGTVTPTTAGLREEARPALNVPRGPAAADAMYLPRLSVAFVAPERTVSPVGIQRRYDALKGARQSPAPRPGAPVENPVPVRKPAIRLRASIEVSVAGRVATLRGVAASEHDRRLAELLAGFEPGIDSVNNQIRVDPQSERSEETRSR